MKTSKTVAISLGILLLARVCWVICFPDYRAFFEPADSWYRELPSKSSRMFREKGKLKETDYGVVAPAMQEKAVNRLLRSPIVALNKSEATAFLSNQKNLKSALQQGKTAFLLRGVYLNQETGGYSVMVIGNSLWVEHDCLGHGPEWMTRQALFVFLKRKPTEVFVTCSMAE